VVLRLVASAPPIALLVTNLVSAVVAALVAGLANGCSCCCQSSRLAAVLKIVKCSTFATVATCARLATYDIFYSCKRMQCLQVVLSLSNIAR
jgi:hypothetical protein